MISTDSVRLSMILSRATLRYQLQEEKYNQLADCYNDMMSFDWKVSENAWKNNGNDKCVSFEPDCGTDEVEQV